MPEETAQPVHTTAAHSFWRLVVAWIVVGVPLGWGVFKSIEKSLPLFDGKARPAALPAPGSDRP
jgi:hypothetical protein